jgi:hypothetical protein
MAAIASGAKTTVLMAAATRPSRCSATMRWVAVTAATIVHGRPTPTTKLPAETEGSHAVVCRALPRPNSIAPAPQTATSPRRVSSRPATRPPAIDPAPCKAASTPTNAGGRCTASTTTAYNAGVATADNVAAAAAVRASAPSGGLVRSARTPSRASRRTLRPGVADLCAEPAGSVLCTPMPDTGGGARRNAA